MVTSMADRWRERKKAWQAFARWTPDESAREIASRLRWLDDALRLARRAGRPEAPPFDSAEIRAHRARIRRALATIRA